MDGQVGQIVWAKLFVIQHHMPYGILHVVSHNLVNISTVNGLQIAQHQAITWTNADLLLIEPLRTNFI